VGCGAAGVFLSGCVGAPQEFMAFMKRQEEQHNTASMLPVVCAPPENARAAHTEP
jgi:hypothetical protein